MRDLVAAGGERSADLREDRHEQCVAVELSRVSRPDPHLGIEPAEQRLAKGVAVVIDLGDRRRLRCFGQQTLEPHAKTNAVAGRAFEDGSLRVDRREGRPERIQPRGIDEITLVDDDDLRLFQLLAVDVAHVFREFRGGEPQHPFGPQRIDDHAHRRHGESVAVDLLERQRHRSHEVGATAHRLGDQHIGRGLPHQRLGRLDQRREPAAEAAAHDLLDRHAVGRGEGRVDEPSALIVRDQSHAKAATDEPFGQPQDRRRLSRTEKAANHHVAGFRSGHASSPDSGSADGTGFSAASTSPSL